MKIKNHSSDQTGKQEIQHFELHTQLFEILEGISDPRTRACNFKHPLTTILFITIVCSLCGANDWEIVVMQANSMGDWLA